MITTSGNWAKHYGEELGHFINGSQNARTLANFLAGETGTPAVSNNVPVEVNGEGPQFSISKNGVDNYTEKQYNDFGWTRDNDILNAGQSQDFFSKFAMAKSGQVTYPKTKSGEYMIEVSDIFDSDAEGVNNTIAYATGSIESPQITKVLKIDLGSENEIELDEARRYVYDCERRGVQPTIGKLFRFHNRVDERNHGNGKGKSNSRVEYSQRNGQRGRSGSQTQRIKSIRFDKDGNEVSRTYHDDINFSLSGSGENTALETQEGAEAPTLSKTFYEARQAVLDADYGVTEADIDSAWRKAQSGEKMTETEALAYDELTAKMMAEVLGNETSIRRMASKAPKLARSILRRIGDLIDSLRGSNASKEELRRLRKAEQLFEDALVEIKETKESALKDYQKAEKAFNKKAGAARRGYERDRKEYRKLKGTVTQEELDAWLREHDYTEEDFADDVLEGEIIEKDVEGDKYSYENYSASDFYTNGEIYSYDFLTAQKEMIMVELPKTGALADQKGKIDDEKVVSEGIKNALSEGFERDGKIYVKNAYTGRELRIDNSTIKHGLDGTYSRHLTNARIGSVIGSVVKNAIPINGLKNTAEKAIGTYAMASYCYDNQNRQFVAIVTVEQHTGKVDGFELYDVAHAVSGRQKKGSQVDTKSPGVYPIEATTISIPRLLEIVNTTHKSILSNDVLAHLGEKRPEKGSYTNKVLFSLAPSDKVLISKGEQQKQRAEYQSDRVYHKKDVVETVKSVKALRLLPNKARNELIDELWRGINYRYHEVHTIENVSNSPASTNHGTEAGHITADNKYIVSHDFDPSRKNENKNGSPIQTNPRKSVEQTVSRATTPDNSIHQIKIGVKKNKFFITATRCSAKRTLRPL